MNRLCIIPCGKRKIWDAGDYAGPAAAETAYTGVFHKLCQTYARMFFQNWTILSAKHGYLLPEDLVPESYDLSFSMKNAEIITEAMLKEQIAKKFPYEFQEIIILGGKKFKPIAEGSFGPNPQFRYPLEGEKGIGLMQRRLKKAIQEEEEIK